MNQNQCVRCHTEVTPEMIHCPVCGYGAIHSDVSLHQPDEPFDSPERVILFCQALLARVHEVSILWQYYINSLIYVNNREIERAPDELMIMETFLEGFDENMLTACKFLAFENAPRITKASRGIVLAYFRIFTQFCLARQGGNGIVTYGSEEDHEMKAAIEMLPELQRQSIAALELLIELQRKLLSKEKGLEDVIFIAQERYYNNAHCAAFDLFDNAINDIRRKLVRGQIEDRLIQDVSLSLQLLNEAAEARNIQNVPAGDQQKFITICKYSENAANISEFFTSVFNSGNMEMLVNEYDDLNPGYRQFVKDIDEIARTFPIEIHPR